VFNGDSLVATIDQETASGNATGTPATHYIHPDHLGSTNVVTNASGTVEQTLDYYPYGGTRISTGQNAANRQYIGQFADQSNLDYLQARYYDSARGQFLTQDPVFLGDPRAQNLADPQSLNSYSYAEDNPITNKDPNGDVTALALAPIILALAAIVGTLTLLQASHGSSAVAPLLTGVGKVLDSVGAAVKTGVVGVASTVLISPAAATVHVTPLPSVGGIGGTAVTTPYSMTPGQALVQNFQDQGISTINFASNGKTTIIEKPGNYDTAKEEFQKLNPTNVKTDPRNGTIYGDLPDGSKAKVRPSSTDSRPTLEIQHENGDTTK
jgi:RHS repeat-associated protein